jgi:hypothetical protein
MTRVRAILALATALVSAGCGIKPPASPVPSVRRALERLHATQDCGVGVHATAKIDHFGKEGRVRGDLLAFAVWPNQLRLDIVSPFGVTLATLTSNGETFSLYDLREKRFLYGPASSCNIARLTSVPVPGHALVSLLRGEAPVLQHSPDDASMVWDTHGYYVVTLKSVHGAEERLHLGPHPSDRHLPWTEQRLRLLDVEVKQSGVVLYHAELEGHAPAAMSQPIVDPDGIDPPALPSGPSCQAELPRTIRLEVPGRDEDMIVRYDHVTWNPPLPSGTFTQPVPQGVVVEHVTCDR